MNNKIKNELVLLCAILCSVALLVSLHEVTKEQRLKQEETSRNEAILEVFDTATSFQRMDSVENIAGYGEYNCTINEVFIAQDATGVTLGYVLIITSHEGYMGDITFSLGIAMDGTTKGIFITSIKETSGMGMLAAEILQPQFKDKLVEMFSYTKTPAVYDNQIDAISGATTTTNAVMNGVNAGLSYFYNELQGGDQNE